MVKTTKQQDEKAPWWLIPSMILSSLAFLGVGIYIFATWIPLLQNDAQVKERSAQTTAVVLSEDEGYLLSASRGGSRVRLAQVEYDVAGKNYAASVVLLRGNNVGETVDILYSMDDPSQATTEQTSGKATSGIVIGSLSGLLGLGGVLGLLAIAFFAIKQKK